MLKAVFMVCLVVLVHSAPQNLPITFDGSNIGVDFLGYRASAGLGGLLTGDTSKGGLHAEAGTPFGQEAGAGIGGVVGADGNTETRKYAYASPGRKTNVFEVFDNLRERASEYLNIIPNGLNRLRNITNAQLGY